MTTTNSTLEEFDKILEEYKASYDVETLATPNDKANLDTIILNTLAMRRLQKRLIQLVSSDDGTSEIKKINDSIRDLTTVNLTIEKQLGIDRNTRRKENEQSITEYINWLKSYARDYLDKHDRIIKVTCKHCKIMVGRVSGVYNTTEYVAEFQCPQCKKMIKVHRKEKDLFFDIKDADWRRKYPYEIVQAKSPKNDEPEDIITEEDDLIISSDELDTATGE